MFALLKKELDDLTIAFALAAIIVTVTLGIVISSIVFGDSYTIPIGIPVPMLQVFFLLIGVVPIAMTVCGGLQMQADRSKKISAYLATLATTRQRILIARIIAGVVLIICFITPFAIADVILLTRIPSLVPIDSQLLRNFFITSFLMNFAGYFLGLSMGWNWAKRGPAIGSIAMIVLIESIVLFKGFGCETWTLLALIAAVCLIKTCLKFTSTPL